MKMLGQFKFQESVGFPFILTSFFLSFFFFGGGWVVVEGVDGSIVEDFI